MHAAEHEQTTQSAEPTRSEHTDHAPTGGAMHLGKGPIPAVQGNVAFGHKPPQATASEQAYVDTSHDAVLAAIQGQAMFALLPALEELPPEALDEGRAVAIGGRRLRLAVRAVRAKRAGVDLQHYATAS